MAANPSVKKRERERKLQERQREKAAKREQRKLDRNAGVERVESTPDEVAAQQVSVPHGEG